MVNDSPPSGPFHELIKWLRDSGVGTSNDTWKNKELAQNLGVSLQTVKDYCAGRTLPPNVEQIAKVFFSTNPNVNHHLRAEFFKRYNAAKETRKSDSARGDYHQTSTVEHFWEHMESLLDCSLVDNHEVNCRTLNDVYWLLKNRFALGNDSIRRFANEAREIAYNQKYGSWSEEQDERYLSGFDNWLNEFNDLLLRNKVEKSCTKLLCVGVGAGLEGRGIYDQFHHFSACDISQSAVLHAKAAFPSAEILQGKAEELPFENNSFDLYVCLKTFSSSFFDIGEAVESCYRCLRSNGLAVISVPRRYYNKDKGVFYEGLSPTNYNYLSLKQEERKYGPPDRNLPIQIIAKIWQSMARRLFGDIKVYTGHHEIYILARKA